MVLVRSERNHFDSLACLVPGRLSMVGLICPINQGRYSSGKTTPCLATGRLSMVRFICPINRGRYKIFKPLEVWNKLL